MQELTSGCLQPLSLRLVLKKLDNLPIFLKIRPVSSPSSSPLFWPSCHVNIPSAFFQVRGADVLRDAALTYKKAPRLHDNVRTRIGLHDGLPYTLWDNHTKCLISKLFAEYNRLGLS